MRSKASQREVAELEARTERKQIKQGKILSFVTDTVFYPDKQVKTFELVIHPGAVVMIPIDHEGNLIFVKQWRRAAKKILIELPSGTLEPGEDPMRCAKRELREEIGRRAEHILSLGGFFTSPGFCSEYLHLFLATHLVLDPLNGDDTHDIDPIRAPLKKAKEWIETGKIADAKTIAGIYRYQDWVQRRAS